jgi:hypothetical protein
MNLPSVSTSLQPSDEAPLPLDPQERELQRQVLAHIRDFGPRKYLTFYNQAKKLKEDGIDAGKVRQSLVGELPSVPPVPEGGTHFISRVHSAKLQAIYHVVRNAVEDALARRPPQFREEHAQKTVQS